MKNISENEKNLTFEYPTCWNNDERMLVLFAPFRVRSVNTESYDSKVIFWQKLIMRYCEHKNESFFNIRELETMFMRNQRKPQCLSEVLQVLQTTGEVRPFNEFYNDPTNSWLSRSINCFVKRPVNWCVNKLKIAFWSTININDDHPQFVLLSLMHTFCDILQTKILSINCGKVLHYHQLKMLVNAADIKLSERCLMLCLHTMHCQRKIYIEYNYKGNISSINLIKIPVSGKKVNLEELVVSEIERTEIILAMSKEKLSLEIQKLEEDIKLNETNLLKYLKKKERALAMLCLRKNKLLQKHHAKQLSAIFNIESLLLSLQNAQIDKEVLDAYKIGSKALQNILKSPDLKYENVEDVVVTVCESLESHNDIQDTLANVVTDNTDELDRELNEIMNDITKINIKNSENEILGLMETLKINKSPMISHSNREEPAGKCKLLVES